MTNCLTDSAIVGVAEAGIGEGHGFSELELHAVSAMAALEDAGISKNEVDGVFSVTNSRQVRRPSLAVSEYLGLTPVVSGSAAVGGASPLLLVQQAMAAISAGQCNTCIITYGSTQRTDRTRTLDGDAEPAWIPRLSYEAPFGLPSPLGSYALVAQRYLHEYGVGPEGMAAAAVAAREWAQRTPGAFRQNPITVDDVLNSPMVSSPLHTLDSCLVTDGAASIVIARRDRLDGLRNTPVWVLGSAFEGSHEIISQMPDLLRPGSDRTIPAALGQSGLRIADIDVALLYDSFTITLLLLLESTGVCGRGEASDFVLSGAISPGGSFPVNPTGGGLSYAHPGINGGLLLVEVVRQLRGGAGERQVKGAETAVCHAVGGALSSHATLILGGAR